MTDTLTAGADKTRTEPAGRAGYIAGLRALADILEGHPEVKLPAPGTTTEFLIMFLDGDRNEAEGMAAAARAIPCTWREDLREDLSESGREYFSLCGDLHGLKVRLATRRSALKPPSADRLDRNAGRCAAT